MAEKPTKKNNVCSKLLLCNMALSVFNSLTLMPVMYERKAGYKGKQHGEMKLRNPAPNAKKILISDISTSPTIQYICLFYQTMGQTMRDVYVKDL